MSKLLLLDFDGVINVLSGSTKGDKQVWPEWETTILDGYHILYSPNVVRLINKISENNDVTIQWLTTWESDSSLFTQLGFHHFDYLSAPAEVTLGHWKVDSAMTVIPDYDTTVWCDDERLVKTLGEERVDLFINPLSETGLSQKKMKLICAKLNIEWRDMILVM